jgi:hypothetical protein
MAKITPKRVSCQLKIESGLSTKGFIVVGFAGEFVSVLYGG